MKLSVKLPWDVFGTLTPSLASSEHPCSPILQEETLMIDVVLTNFPMWDLDETFSKASLGYYGYPDTISSSIRNLHVLQDSRKRLGG